VTDAGVHRVPRAIPGNRQAWRIETTARAPAPAAGTRAAPNGARSPDARRSAADSLAVSEVAITMRVLRHGTRTEELLGVVARQFGSDRVWRDDYGAVHVRVSGRRATAWDELRDALDAAGGDWRQWLHLGPRPSGWRT